MASSSLWQRFQFAADMHAGKITAENGKHIRVAPGEEPTEERFSIEQER
jgi:hypothetical protein